MSNIGFEIKKTWSDFATSLQRCLWNTLHGTRHHRNGCLSWRSIEKLLGHRDRALVIWESWKMSKNKNELCIILFSCSLPVSSLFSYLSSALRLMSSTCGMSFQLLTLMEMALWMSTSWMTCWRRWATLLMRLGAKLDIMETHRN